VLERVAAYPSKGWLEIVTGPLNRWGAGYFSARCFWQSCALGCLVGIPAAALSIHLRQASLENGWDAWARCVGYIFAGNVLPIFVSSLKMRPILARMATARYSAKLAWVTIDAGTTALVAPSFTIGLEAFLIARPGLSVYLREIYASPSEIFGLPRRHVLAASWLYGASAISIVFLLAIEALTRLILLPLKGDVKGAPFALAGAVAAGVAFVAVMLVGAVAWMVAGP
jgi:hypothetical protein